jgi:hypothetical protein
MVGQIIGGLGGIASGIIGSRKRKEEQREAQREFDRNKARFSMLDTSNVYTNMQNTMEDLTVNQQQAQFQAEQANQGLVNIMGGLQGAAGGSGIAALAQSLAGQQANQIRQASIDIGRQEQANQQAAAQQAANIQLYERKGELISRDAEREKVGTLLGMSQQRLAAANLAREQATQNIVSGVGGVLGGVAGGLAGTEAFGGTSDTFMKSIMGN